MVTVKFQPKGNPGSAHACGFCTYSILHKPAELEEMYDQKALCAVQGTAVPGCTHQWLTLHTRAGQGLVGEAFVSALLSGTASKSQLPALTRKSQKAKMPDHKVYQTVKYSAPNLENA